MIKEWLNIYILEIGEEGRTEGGVGEVEGEVAQTMCTHVSKCKRDKIKGEKKIKPCFWQGQMEINPFF
jgi:hypothetical protein